LASQKLPVSMEQQQPSLAALQEELRVAIDTGSRWQVGIIHSKLADYCNDLTDEAQDPAMGSRKVPTEEEKIFHFKKALKIWEEFREQPRVIYTCSSLAFTLGRFVVCGHPCCRILM